ncbi:hypothetical protein [Actinophytocola gossypii]|uniref:Uncharacterized protein n=1 Tax=Actinophytocola gossypii TaxID=2812003 RepID=A0ABT2JEA4_9PSEU|nr:hypothetical protein [Actinophytocola gossypii]MCT2586083.1 hypothetical protein [Actinophytocola gossypii]
MRMPALGASLATSGAVGVASDLTTAPSGRVRMLPVHPDLAALFPWGGLRRGSTVSVRGSTSLLLALLAEATAGDSWAAVVGLPDVGMVAAAELGVAVDRVALVRNPGAEHPRVVAALLDGMDLVVTARGRLTDAQARRLSARARHRGAVLLTTDPWPTTDVDLYRTTTHWSGLGEGHGHLTHRETTIRSQGRGAATRPVHVALQLPGRAGAVAPVPAPHLHRVRAASPRVIPRTAPVPNPRVPRSQRRTRRTGTSESPDGSASLVGRQCGARGVREPVHVRVPRRVARVSTSCVPGARVRRSWVVSGRVRVLSQGLRASPVKAFDTLPDRT